MKKMIILCLLAFAFASTATFAQSIRSSIVSDETLAIKVPGSKVLSILNYIVQGGVASDNMTVKIGIKSINATYPTVVTSPELGRVLQVAGPATVEVTVNPGASPVFLTYRLDPNQ